MTKTVKKMLLTMTIIATLILCLAFSASALTETGKCGDNVYWDYDSETKELVISGEGPMWFWGEYTMSVYKSPFYGSDVKTVVINYGVTTIGSEAFSNCDSLISVIIPDSITTIGERAFSNCDSLISVIIPDSITTIGEWAFSNCDGLIGITVDKSNREYSSDEYGVLFNKDKTTLIQYPKGNKRTSYTIPDSVITIRSEAFSSCDGLTNVTIGNNVTTIGEGAFCSCDGLTSVNISDSVTTIGNWAFDACNSLTSVNIPDSVTAIGIWAFNGCKSLISITVDEKNQNYSSDEYGVLFSKYKTKLIQYPIGNKRTSYTIPDNVITIGSYAFGYCDSLTRIIMSDSLATISADAFKYCNSLELYYTGTEVQWRKMLIEQGEGVFSDITIHYNYCVHKNKATYLQQNPTCTEAGYTVGTYCPNCEKWLEGHKEIPAINHKNKTTHAQQPPTCTEIGYTAGTYCPDCEEWLEGHKKISAKGHTFTEKIIDDKHLKSKATVDSAAIYKYDCAVCDVISSDKTFTHGKALTLGITEKITVAQTASTITLTWNKAENATGYRLYYKLPGDLSWRQCVSYTTATSYTFNNLPSGQSYRFAVRSAYVKADVGRIYGGYKEIATATKAPAPSKIIAAQNTSAIRLTWTKCEGATGYQIFYKTATGWKVCVKATTATTHTFTGLKSGAKFTFAVRPYIIVDGTVIWSDYTQFTTATKPANPAFKVTSPSKGKISLTFGAVNGADGYQVFYKTGNGAYKLYNTFGKTGTLNFSNLKSGTKYTFAVRAGIRTSGGNIFGGYREVSVTVK